MTIKYLVHEDVLRWYGLSWLPTELAIRVSVDRCFLTSLGSFQTDVVQSFIETFGFTSFSGTFEQTFGFEGALVILPQDGEIVEFLGSIPPVRVKTEGVCPECRGSKKSRWDDESECFFCNGSGEKYEYRWGPAYALSASLDLLLKALEYPEQATSRERPQLLTVHLVTEQGQHGGSLGGAFSIPLCQWLAAKGRGVKIPEMIHAMTAAHRWMIGGARTDPRDFYASIDHENGWLNVGCPGDRCGLHPADSWLMPGRRGYRFSCHNVDTMAQQLTLLAGLAALHDRVDGELYG